VPIQTRKFKVLLVSTLPARTRSGSKKDGTTSGETTTENDVQSLDFDFFSFRFCDRSVSPALRTRIPWGCHPISTVDATAASGQLVRLFRLVRTTTTATYPAWFSHRFPRTLQSSLARVRFHRMTIAQRTTLSNQLRLCRIPEHSRRRGRLQRHVRSPTVKSLPFPATYHGLQARKEP
jgi:hypothetical protein